MARTFQEISNRLETSITSPLAREGYEHMLDAYASDEQFETEAEAVEQLIADALEDQVTMGLLLDAIGADRTYVVVGTIYDGYNEMFVSRQITALSREEAQAIFTDQVTDPDAEALGEKLDIDATYGPF